MSNLTIIIHDRSAIDESGGELGVLAGRRFSQAEVKGLLAQAGWPSNLIETMSAIVMAESSGYAEAHNPSGEDSWGLAQVNRRAWKQYSVAQLKDPLTNLQIAYKIYKIQGFRAWGAYTHPKSKPRYKAFLGKGGDATNTTGGDSSSNSGVKPATIAIGGGALLAVIAAVVLISD
jgi:hypothetical protein